MTTLSDTSVHIACFGDPSIVFNFEYMFIVKNFNPPNEVTLKIEFFENFEEKITFDRIDWRFLYVNEVHAGQYFISVYII